METGIKPGYISIEGNIGAGKTTLAKLLAEQTGSRLLLEHFESNPYLERFYTQPEAYNFHVEMYFLTERYKTLVEELGHSDELIIADYAFHKSLYFAEVNLQQPEIGIFRQSYELMRQQLPAPELVIYLYHDINRVQQRIKQRGRSYENAIAAEYLEKVQQSYLQHLKKQPGQVIILNATDRDFLNNCSNVADVLQLINTPRTPGLSYLGFPDQSVNL